MSRTFLAVLQFDGGRFLGWQRQATGRTVQAAVEGVLERLTGRRVVAHGAGRTDAGVHAQGMGVSFSLAAKWEPDAVQRALNALLPRDCWVERVRLANPGFHARKSALGREYRYVVGVDPASMSPFRRPYEWALGRALDPDRLREAAAPLPGEHSFRAFAVKGEPKPHYRSTLRRAEWREREAGQGFTFHVAADRFLHHMVRMLVGTMVDIGLGRRPVEDMAALLARDDNADTSPPAPPEGLYFVSAQYAAEAFADHPGDAA
ncbi:MAG: tRNA pseudouridine(38-40) synthase TruA [Gemmatimonadales bacterium]|jgi:tRNA pseudouridine38-40 synthase|nr:MAG: tRNA pseudouridine(38-40) synthase TruA [Gemmatimonadales bacterium]